MAVTYSAGAEPVSLAHGTAATSLIQVRTGAATDSDSGSEPVRPHRRQPLRHHSLAENPESPVSIATEKQRRHLLFDNTIIPDKEIASAGPVLQSNLYARYAPAD